MNFELFIARRIYADNNKDGKRFSRPAIRIALAGIAVGVAVMVASLGVVVGFKKEVSHKVIGFGSHVEIISLTQTYKREILPVLTGDSLYQIVTSFPEVKHVQRFANKLGMLKTKDDFCGVSFKGLSAEYDTTFLHESLISGHLPKIVEGESSNEIILSNTLAKKLHISLGNKVFAYFINDEGMRARRFYVCGIYETHMTEYDKSYVMTDLYTIQRLNNWDEEMTSGYEIMLHDYDKVDEATLALSERINGNLDRNGVTYGAFSIRQLAPHTFSWLDVLDVNVVMIVILMILVSAFTVVSGLLIIMLERIGMIGVLKALGSNNFSIRKIFLFFAIMLVGKGMLIGNILGIAICYLQQYFKIAKLDASIYYVSYVPIEMNWLYILLVNIFTVIIASIVIFGSSYLVSISKPTKSMRWE